MLLVSVILSLLAAIGTVAIALKYILGPAPAGYHREMIAAQGGEISDVVVKITWALNKVFGFSLVGIALAMAGLAIFGVYADIFWAKALLLLVGAAVCVPLAAVTFKMEKATGVKTPWRPAVIMLAITVTAFGFSIV